jgi:hypothetical protein
MQFKPKSLQPDYRISGTYAVRDVERNSILVLTVRAYRGLTAMREFD